MKNALLFLLWCVSGVLFIANCIVFLKEFLFTTNWDIWFYILWMIPLAISATLFLVCDKKVKNRTTYTQIECKYFYSKCKKLGINERHTTLSNNDKEIIKNKASEMAYFSNFETDDLIAMYNKGLAKSKKR